MENTAVVEKTVALLVRECVPCVEHDVDPLSRLIFGTPLSSLGFSALVAPRVEMYTVLACRVHAPEYEPHDLHLVQPQSMLTMNATWTQDGFTLDVPIAAHGSVQPVSLYIPASPSPSKQHISESDRNQCASDPVVQAAVARLSAGPFVVFLVLTEWNSYRVVLATSMGVLACFTTAWWGSVRPCIHVIN